jgi:transcriptional regulator with XRE-family HTH domain
MNVSPTTSVSYRVEKIPAGGIFLSVGTSSFGQNLKRLRKASGLRANVVASRAGVTAPMMSSYENDRTGIPEVPTLFRFAKALNVSIEEILEGVDPEYDIQRDLSRQTNAQHLASLHPQPDRGANDTEVVDQAGLLSEERHVAAQQHAAALREIAGRLLELAAGGRPAEKTEDAEGDTARDTQRRRTAGR